MACLNSFHPHNGKEVLHAMLIIEGWLSPFLNLLETVHLFTCSDYKTILFPVTMFALVAAPARSLSRLLCTELWIWLHLIQANISNQTFTAHEDIINKPWRPIPSGRVTVRQARTLRWTMMIICLLISSFFGFKTVFASAALTLVEIVHDDFHLSGHPVYKNLCNVGGYLTFEVGATLVLSSSCLDSTTHLALLCSMFIIFTTIHAQDFADVYGDQKSGRLTIPILAPEGSRILMLVTLLAWSFFLTMLWGLGPLCGVMFILMGLKVGLRYFYLRTVRDDSVSYLFYNVWLLAAHLLPTNARMGILSW